MNFLAKASAYFELIKPRITFLVVLTTAAGYYLAPRTLFDWGLFTHALFGTGLIAGGTAVLNQVMEVENDGLMRRTAHRPLPSKRVSFLGAVVFGLILVLIATFYLGILVNPLTAGLGFLTCVIYLALYTPLKTRTSLCTTIGAISGAMPPLMGWAAAAGSLDLQAWLLFAILFLWQYPHFLAIAWVYREDYQRGGFRMLPLLDRDGKRTGIQVVAFNLALLGISAFPAFSGLAGMAYLGASILLGTAFLWCGVLLAQSRSRPSAKRLLRASVLYLPLLLVVLVADKV